MQPFEELIAEAIQLGPEATIVAAITVSQVEQRIVSIGYDKLPWGREKIIDALREVSDGSVYETRERFGVIKAASTDNQKAYTVNFVDSSQVTVENGDILGCETTVDLVSIIGRYHTIRSIRGGLQHTCEQLLHVREYFKEEGNIEVVERIDQIDALTASLCGHLLKDQIAAGEAVREAGGTVSE